MEKYFAQRGTIRHDLAERAQFDWLSEWAERLCLKRNIPNCTKFFCTQGKGNRPFYKIFSGFQCIPFLEMLVFTRKIIEITKRFRPRLSITK